VLDVRSMSVMEMLSKEVNMMMSDKLKSDDEEGNQVSLFTHLEKADVLQKARIFHDSVMVRENPLLCCTIMVQIIHLQNTVQALNLTESTEVFFAASKLFMSHDAHLRRMVYLFIKEMAPNCDPNDVIIVTSCLTKDLTSDANIYRANSLRVLARIIDAAMLGAIERYVRQAMIDSSNQVSSAALISAIKLFQSSTDSSNVVKRWLNEAQKAIGSSNKMVQFHALQLLYQMKSHDRLGVSKLITQCSKRSFESPMAMVLLVRFTAKMIHDEYVDGKEITQSHLSRTGLQYLERSLRHKSDIVVYEAAKSICGLPGIEPHKLNDAVTALQISLSSPKPAVRYASVKTLAAVSSVYPRTVSKCNENLEVLITDSNRSIGTLAITALLRTTNENSIGRRLIQISSFLTEATDDFKIVVVQSLERLCLTFTSKYGLLIGFLSNLLRDDGGFDFKKSIVNTIISLMHNVPERLESSLLHLCEFVEDCEYTALSTQILHLLGDFGPKTSSPAQYIRFVYNRVILEKAAVRAAAVSTLAKFAASVPSLRESIMILLKRSLVDGDDETRDRAAIAVSILNVAIEENPYITHKEHFDAEVSDISDVPSPDDSAVYLFRRQLPMTFEKLERSLKAYIDTPGAVESTSPLTFSSLPILEDLVDEGSMEATHGRENGALDLTPLNGPISLKKEKVDPAAVVYAVPELASFGRVFRSSSPLPLTETETEYVVTCTKHVLSGYVILQFNVENTIGDQRLEEVRAVVEGDSTVFNVIGEISAPSILCGETKNCFTVLQQADDHTLSPTSFSCELRFNAVTIDSSGEELGDSYEEEYTLEDFEISISDFLAKVKVNDFRRSWESMGNRNEVLEKVGLKFKNLTDAVAAVIDFLGMLPCDGTSLVKVKNKGKPHMLHLSGVFVSGCEILARAQIILDETVGVVLKIAVRSADTQLSRLVIQCIQ